jgi:hypothetical protein
VMEVNLLRLMVSLSRSVVRSKVCFDCFEFLLWHLEFVYVLGTAVDMG